MLGQRCPAEMSVFIFRHLKLEWLRNSQLQMRKYDSLWK